MKGEEIREQLAALHESLSTLQQELDEAEEASSQLKEQFEEAEGRLVLKRREVVDYERRISEHEERLREAERNEARERYEEAAVRLADAISLLLLNLEEYETAEGNLSKVEKVSAREKPEVLRGPWEGLREAVRARSDIEFADEVVNAAARSRMPEVIDALPAHLREVARARIQALRRERSQER
jgi:chromosome segregation ATPase